MRLRTVLMVVCGPLLCGQTVGAAELGVPNFSPDAGTGWRVESFYMTPLPGGPKPVELDPSAYDAAHPFRPLQSFPIVDLNNPNLQPWVIEALRAQNARVRAGETLHYNFSNCQPFGLPTIHQMTGRPIYLVQGKNDVAMIHQYNSEVRHVMLDRGHSAQPKPSSYGESVGHYENGDTLVIDTIGLNDKISVDFYRTPHTPALHVTERWTLTDGGRAMDVSVKIDDPGAFKAAYEVRQRYRRVDEPWLEFVCAENPGGQLLLKQGLDPVPQSDKPDF